VITTHSIQTAFDASIKRLREKKEQLKEKIHIEFIQKGKKSAPVIPHVMGSLLGVAGKMFILSLEIKHIPPAPYWRSNCSREAQEDYLIHITILVLVEEWKTTRIVPIALRSLTRLLRCPSNTA